MAMCSTTHRSSLLLPALLSAFHKRQYVKVNYIRTASIFPSRQALLDYEEMLALEWRVDEALSGNRNTARNSPKQKPILKGKGAKGNSRAKVETTPSENKSRVQCAKMVRDIWMSIYDRWKALVACEEERAERGLERFECGASVALEVWLNHNSNLNYHSGRSYTYKNSGKFPIPELVKTSTNWVGI